MKMDNRNLNDLRVVDLKKELELRGLPKSGSKKELVDRLKAQMAIEQLRGSSNVNEGDAPSLQVACDEENQFVKNYLQQRQKLLSQQMEQKKKFEEEASMSQNECELDESNVSESQNAESSVVNQSDDDTDVESIPETSTEQIDASVNQINSYAGSSSLDQLSAKEQTDVASSSQARSDIGNDNGISLESTSNAHEASFSSPKRQPRSRSRSQSSHEAQDESPSRHSNRSSRSRSRANSESRFRSRSNSSNSRSSSQEKSMERSRPPSEERKLQKEDTRFVERKRSLSKSPEKSKSPSLKNITNEISSVEPDRSASPSVTKLPLSENSSVEDDRSNSPSEAVLPVLDACNVEQIGFGDNESAVKTYTNVVKPTELSTEDAEIIESESFKLELTSSRSKDEIQEDNESQSPNVVDSKGLRENVSTSEVSSESTKPVRKRRWGSASVQTAKPSINISTDSLKGLIPEVDSGSISMETTMEFEEAADSLNKESDLETDAHAASRTDNDSTENGDTRAAKMRRTVYEVSNKGDTNKSDDIEATEVNKKTEEESVATSIRLVKAPVAAPVTEASNKIDDGSRQVRLSRTVSLVVEDPVDVGRKSPSPSRHPPSNVVHVTGLVRPYTLGQLKELLGRTGTLQPDGFWIDNIKSHCYVVYATLEEAVATRKALHGKRWPATNPKLLGVDFRTMDEFEKRKNNIVVRENTIATPVSAGNQLQPIENKRDQEKARSGNENLKDMKKSPRDAAKPPIKENRDRTAGVVPVREWDRNKLRQSRSLSQEKRRKDDKAKAEARDKRETSRHDPQKSRDDRRGRSRMDKSESGAKVEEEPPAKLLDDLFRKTVAMPCIYWLPLTDEQANEKIALEKQERLLRDQMREQRRIEREQQAEVDRQQRLKAQEDRVRQDHSRDRQPAQRRKQFSEADDSSRRRGRSRSGGRANRR